MKCDELRQNLAAYLDGEVEGAPRQAMDGHFAVCAACAAERKAQAAAWRLLDLAPIPVVPAGFADRTAARTGEPGPAGAPPGGRVFRFPLPAAAAAAALLVAGGAIWLRPGRDADAPDGTPVSSAAPSEALLENLPVIESLDALEDGDLDLLDHLSGLGDEDLQALGG